MSAASSDSPAGQLEAERAVNEQYMRRVDAAVARHGINATQVATPRNSVMHGQGARPAVARANFGPIEGRVALDINDELLGQGFYVGPRNEEWEGVLVVSFAARVASLYFEGRRSPDRDASHVVGQRTFLKRGRELTKYTDELLDPLKHPNPFVAVGGTQLSVPMAPQRASRPRPALQPAPKAEAPALADGSRPQSPVPTSDDSRTRGAGEPSSSPATPPHRWHPSAAPASTPPPRPDVPVLRAAAVVKELVSRERTGQLHSVLATLQPDQYELVTADPYAPLMVQGQPGTGKTIIATHRAAFLLNPDRDDDDGVMQLPLNVLVVGPTDGYKTHVRGVFRELGAQLDHLTIGTVEDVLNIYAELTEKRSPQRFEYLDVDHQTFEFAERVVRALGPKSKGQAIETRVRSVVEALLAGDARVAALISPERNAWIKECLGTWAKAKSSSRALPFLAALGVSLRPPNMPATFDHVIVDEAQDLTPIEWAVLKTLVRTPGAVSLFGDVHQRRSDWSPANWQDVVRPLTGSSVEEHVLTSGYRSTKQILRFANRLLPKAARSVHAVLDGDEPRVIRVPATALVSEVITNVSDLCAKHPNGLVAVLATEPTKIGDALRKKGWLLSTGATWKQKNRRLQVLPPGDARGLEYDGVVVVEPSAFPENVGRRGVLYTSLTRATKSLVVVHSQPLPVELRGKK